MDQPLAHALEDLRSAARGRGVLVALDFDGVLAPLVDDPSASRALPESVEALGRLAAAPGVHLAVVSGRTMADLATLAEVPEGTHLVGSHGGERGRQHDGAVEREDVVLDEEAARRLAELTRRLEEFVDGTPGARVERKPAAVVLHTRTAGRDDAARLTEAALALGEGPGVDAMRGKDVVELSVLHVTKGDALASLREELGVEGLLYAGDDVTDERAFATLLPSDVTIRVGDGDTAARFRVADPQEMARALARLAELLEAR